jgi:hypothetical protein
MVPRLIVAVACIHIFVGLLVRPDSLDPNPLTGIARDARRPQGPAVAAWAVPATRAGRPRSQLALPHRRSQRSSGQAGQPRRHGTARPRPAWSAADAAPPHPGITETGQSSRARSSCRDPRWLEREGARQPLPPERLPEQGRHRCMPPPVCAVLVACGEDRATAARCRHDQHPLWLPVSSNPAISASRSCGLALAAMRRDRRQPMLGGDEGAPRWHWRCTS